MNGRIDLPLAGMRVLDLTGELGRYPGRVLADLGAEVVRVEGPGVGLARDAGPRVGPARPGSCGLRVRDTGPEIVALDPARRTTLTGSRRCSAGPTCCSPTAAGRAGPTRPRPRPLTARYPRLVTSR